MADDPKVLHPVTFYEKGDLPFGAKDFRPKPRVTDESPPDGSTSPEMAPRRARRAAKD